MLEGTYGRFEADLGEQPQPVVACEETMYVSVVRAPCRLTISLEQVGEVHHVSGVGRIRVPDPGEVAHCSPVAVVSSVRGGGDERFPREVGREQGDTAGPTVHEAGFHGSPQVDFRGQI